MRVPKSVKTFALASFLHDVGGDAVASLWPVFLTSVIGAPPALIGVIDGLGESMVYISQGVFGYLSDRYRKRKIFVIVGYLCGGLARVGYALSTTTATLLPLRLLDRGGKLRSAPRDAIVAEVSVSGSRGRNFGIIRAFDNLGSVVGVMFSLILFDIVSIRTIFFLACIPSLFAVLLVAKNTSEKTTHIPKRSRLRWSDFSSNFKRYTFACAVMSLGIFTYTFLLVYAKTVGGFAAATIPALYLVIHLTSGSTSYFFGKFSDKVGRKKVVLFAYLFWIICCALLLISGSKLVLLLALVLFGLHTGALDTVQKTFASELSSKQFLTSSLGAFDFVVGLAALPASIIAGSLWQFTGPSSMFVFSICVSILGLLLLLGVKERH